MKSPAGRQHLVSLTKELIAHTLDLSFSSNCTDMVLPVPVLYKGFTPHIYSSFGAARYLPTAVGKLLTYQLLKDRNKNLK